MTVGTIKTHVVRRGDHGPAIVLIHGFGANTYTWRATLAGLEDRFRLFAIDLKGFGLTEKPNDGRYFAGAYVEHLLATLDALGLEDERPILVGNSMGGSVVAELALRHPDRVGGLVLVDAIPIGLPGSQPFVPPTPAELLTGGGNAPPRRARREPVSPVLLRAIITRSLVEKALRSSFHDPSRVTPEMVDAYYIPTTIEGAMDALAAMMSPPPEAAEAPPLPSWETFKAPVLVVWGRHDRDIPVEMADAFVRAIPGARRILFEGSAHLPHEEEAEAFNAHLADFAASIP